MRFQVPKPLAKPDTIAGGLGLWIFRASLICGLLSCQDLGRGAVTSKLIMTYVTVPEQIAEELAKTLVDKKLAACVNILPAVRSVYRWEGKTTTESEVLLLIKTTDRRFDALRNAIVTLHPYDIPEIVAIPVEYAHPAYASWVRTETEVSK